MYLCSSSSDWILLISRSIYELSSRRNALSASFVIIGGSLEKAETEHLKKWIENGGTLIAYRNALQWLNRNDIVKYEFKSKDNVAKNISFEQRGNFRGAQVIGGAIFEARQDRSHPINFGYKNDKVALFRNNTIFIKPNKQSYNNPLQYSKNPLLSGYISDKTGFRGGKNHEKILLVEI